MNIGPRSIMRSITIFKIQCDLEDNEAPIMTKFPDMLVVSENDVIALGRTVLRVFLASTG